MTSHALSGEFEKAHQRECSVEKRMEASPVAEPGADWSVQVMGWRFKRYKTQLI